MYKWLLTSSSCMLTPNSPQLLCGTELSKHTLTKTEKTSKLWYISAQTLLLQVLDAAHLLPRWFSKLKFLVSYLCVFCLNKHSVPDPFSVSILYLCVETQ